MSTTTTINPTNSGNSTDNKKNVAAFAATATAAAAAGVAGAHIVSDLNDSDGIVSEDNVILEETTDSAAQADPTTGTAASTATATPSSNPSATTSTASTVEPQPITTNDVVEPDVTIEPASGTSATVDAEATETATVNNASDGVVNPDEIAQAIISEERIDPNDIDMADVINFDEIGTVYTVDGESYTAAAFHDAGGNGFVMVDVDGDDVFDVITDYDGNLLAEVPGNISVGDAQEDIHDDGEYLAYDGDLDNVDEYGADSLADDLMA